MNSFVDAVPAFPYFSSEARSVLGIPDSMEVHLAVTELATALLEVARSSGRPAREQRVESLRVASGAVLFGWPLPLAERELRFCLGMPPNDAPFARYRGHEGKDWLGEAVARLREQGLPVRTGYSRQRTDYGWHSIE